eukprot:TRINITY_DN18344_c0_g1_i2.p1 TRINITY_DN18344_c0_g1~~TRINITY_DN18344_c0_g1_i2.p1  ORF type:complete len:504 (+),score=147.52 TRINITY_DN18344_c0_g1_i2:56-1513(+)
MAISHPLASKLSQYKGEDGRLKEENKEELRRLLLTDFEQALGARHEAVEDEVNKFLNSGRASDSNLNRLQRRVQARISGSRSARSESRSSEAIQELSALAAQSGSQTARERRQSGGSAALQSTKPSQSAWRTRPDMATVPEEDDIMWSQFAKLAKRELELEQDKKQKSVKKSQQELSDFLQAQVSQKKMKERIAAEENIKFFQMQEAEMARWKADEILKAQERAQKVEQLRRERDMQTAEKHKREEKEKSMDRDEDKRWVMKGKEDLEKEQRALQEKKDRNKRMQAAEASQVAARISKKAAGMEALQNRIDAEQKIIAEYAEVLKAQDERSHMRKPKIHQQLLELPEREKRRGEELYYDDELVTKTYKEALEKSEQAEKQKQDRLKMERYQIRDYLFKQMAERDQQKKVELDQKEAQMQIALAAAAEHKRLERQRSEDIRHRSEKYKKELEKQVQAKRSGTHLSEDQMSQDERAMNRRLITENMV